MGVVRILVSIVTHILLQEDMQGGLALMKYALNHPWKFVSYARAFFAGFIQVAVVIIVELTTFYILVFASDHVFDILANYAIVLVIADFSKNFASIEGGGRVKKLMEEKFEKIFTWEVTTSSSAIDKIKANELKPEDILSQSEAD